MTLFAGISSLAFAAIFAFFAFFFVLRPTIDVPAFMNTIKKCIIAGNTTRAIALAKLAPKSTLTKAIRSLLFVSQNPHRLYFTYKEQEARCLNDIEENGIRVTLQYVGYIFILACLAALFFNPLDGLNTAGGVTCAMAIALIGALEIATARRMRQIALEQHELFCCANLLFHWQIGKNPDRPDKMPTLLKSWHAEPLPDPAPQTAPLISDEPIPSSNEISDSTPDALKPDIMEKL